MSATDSVATSSADVRQCRLWCMTKLLSFRVSDDDALAINEEAERAEVPVSELLRAGVRAVLARAAATRDALIYERSPVVPCELIDPSDQAWLADEDWSAWLDHDAAR